MRKARQGQTANTDGGYSATTVARSASVRDSKTIASTYHHQVDSDSKISSFYHIRDTEAADQSALNNKPRSPYTEAAMEGDPNKIALLGDALVIAGTVCYAFSNVGEEYCVKKNDRVEVVAMLGLFGVLVSTIQILIFERKSVEAIVWSLTMISLFAGYAIAGFMFYAITPFVLKMSGATLFNLSLLTSDMWAVAIRVFFYQQQINWLYYLAFAVVAIGLIIYSLNESSSADGTATSTEAAADYQQLPSEDNSTGSGSNLGRKERKQQEAHIC